VAKQGDLVLESLTDSGKRLARRLLFRLLRFPDSGDDFGSDPTSPDELRKLSWSRHVDGLLEQLRAAGIVSINEQDNTVALTYLALTRRWKWLADEIKKRMNFRARALNWLESNRSWGALLSWPLARRYRSEYSNFNDWEQEFLNKSDRAGRIKFIGGAAGALLIGTIVFLSTSTFRNYYGPWRAPSVTQEILKRETSERRKVEDLKWLADYSLKIDVPEIKLDTDEEKDLSGIRAPGAVFSDGKMREVKFDRALLNGASFAGSVIGQSSFKKASLIGANFDVTQLCEDVDFTDADVRNASFKRTSFFKDSIPKFDGTAWWLASGWGFDQIMALHQSYPVNRIKDSERFKGELGSIDSMLQQETDLYTKAQLLNSKAWKLAIYGVVSDGTAEKTARDASNLLEDQKGSVRDKLYAGSQDTLAYILLQEQDPEKQKKSLQEAVDLLGRAEGLGVGELYFRYAVALHAANRQAEAKEKLENAVREKQYEPSHELYLLYRYFTGEFKNEVMNLTRTPRWLPPDECPAVKR
jgi:hypothetical protein